MHGACKPSIVCLWLCAMTCKDFALQPYVKMVPNTDQFLLVGANLHLNCSVELDSVDATADSNFTSFAASGLTITLPNNLMTNKHITWYNDTKTLTLELFIPDVTLDYNGRYQCNFGEYYDITQIYVKEPPGNLTNLMCLSNNFSDLVCRAVVDKPSKNLSLIWKMIYQLSDKTLTVNCTCLQSEVIINCNRLSESFKQNHSYTVTVQGTNTHFNVSVKATFVIQTSLAIVKPAPVEFHLHYTNDSSSVNLEFTKFLPVVMEFRLNIISENCWDNRTLYIKPDTSSIPVHYTLKDLVPYANYSVTVYIKPVEAVGDIYWSNKTELKFVTQDDVPGKSPQMTVGSFYTFEYSELMYVVLYWKNPPKQYWHGNISYVVEIKSHATGEQEATKVPLPSENIVSYKLHQGLKKTEYYEIEMRTVTRKGYSAGSAGVVVPSWETAEAYKPKCVAVEIDDDRVSVSWMVDKNLCASITTVTYYWCKSSEVDVSFGCQNAMDWYIVNVTNGCEQSTQQWLNRTGDQSNFKFAVSVAAGNVSGGLAWEQFRFNKFHAVPSKPHYNVTVLDKSTVHVSMIYANNYTRDGGRPQSFQILYKVVSEESKPYCPTDGIYKSFPANLTNPVMTLDDLVPDTEYVACVQAINHFGYQMGNPRLFQTSVDASNNKSLILSITISIGVCIVIGVLIFVRRKVKLYILNNTNIEMPNTDNDFISF